jgi:hypothetical protein
MRSFALTVLLGSLVASSGVVAQSLTEHAAAAAGATIGTAAGKPLGTALGKVFGDVDKSASTAATPKTAKPIVVKPTETTAHAPVAPTAFAGGGDGAAGSVGSSGGGVSSHRAVRRRERVVDAEVLPPAPATPVMVPVAAQVVVREPTTEEMASIKVGTTSSELRDMLGMPESRVSIPGDDGHLLEICQYWAKGEPVGTVRLDNGRVISVRTQN